MRHPSPLPRVIPRYFRVTQTQVTRRLAGGGEDDGAGSCMSCQVNRWIRNDLRKLICQSDRINRIVKIDCRRKHGPTTGLLRHHAFAACPSTSLQYVFLDLALISLPFQISRQMVAAQASPTIAAVTKASTNPMPSIQGVIP